MRRFWWVNHNQTARQEIDGQYLWSPKVERNGARSEFYNNMRRTTPGDLVLSYSDQAIRHVGRVAEFAFAAPKPAEFGVTGSYWNTDGWLLPVFWTPLTPPVRPQRIMERLGPLLPSKYSPIHPKSGSGNQKAYLAAIPDEVFSEIAAHSHFDRDVLARGGSNSLTYQVVTELLDDVVERQVLDDVRLSATIKEMIVKARRGQGKFRADVQTVERECRLTGVDKPSLLIASHIKPWRLCSSSEERLDGMNGLMLTPDADLLFDRGFISFEDDGEILVSPRFDREDLRRLGFQRHTWEQLEFAEVPTPWRTKGFVAPQRTYLAFHRSEVFVA